MQISRVKPEKRYDKKKYTSYGIQGFGDKNDYPQRVIELVQASTTGSACLRVYSKFILGKGFKDTKTYQLRANDLQTLDGILELVAADYAKHGAFSIHVNYNANYQIVNIHHIPVENVRLGLPNEDNKITTVAIHPDWGQRNTQIRAFKTADIDTIDLYCPDPAVIDAQVAKAEGWDKWKGQVLYYSNNGPSTYGLPIFDSALVDMNTEEAVSDITNRNAANGFIPAAMMVEIKNNRLTPVYDEDGNEVEQEDEDDTFEAIKEFQGSRNACKIMHITVDSKEEVPEIKQLTGTNYDKEYQVSRNAVKDSIGRAFNQPPVLRAEQTAQGFSTDVMNQAYDFYNSFTQPERLVLERIFTEIFAHWDEPLTLDFEIDPCTFNAQMTLAERLGDNRLGKLIEIINGNQDKAVKINMARIIFGLTDEEIASIFAGDVKSEPKTPQAV